MTLIVFIVMALTALAATPSPAPVPCCDSAVTPIEGAAIYELRDGEGALSLEEVRSAAHAEEWKANAGGVPSKGYTTASYWFWFSVVNPSDQTQRIVLEYAWPVMSDIDVHVVASAGVEDEWITSFVGGSSRRFDERPLPYHHLAVPYDLSPGETVDVLSRIETNAPLQLPVRIHNTVSLHLSAQHSGTLWGLYFGFMLVIALYNLMLYFSLREAGHLYLALFVTSLTGLQASFSGHVHQYLFASWPTLNVYSLPVFLNGTVLLGLLFTMDFLALRRTAPRFHRFLLLTLAATAVNLVVVTPLSLGVSTAAGNVLALPACLGALAVGVFLALRGLASAKVYTAAWMVFLLGATVLALNKLGLVPYNGVTEYGWSVGAMILAVLLSLGLAQSVHKLRRQREEVQELVDVRTVELEKQTEEALRAWGEVNIARREAEESRKEAEQYAEKLEIIDKQKTAFFRNVSHELRTPLTLILNPLDEETRGRPENRNIKLAAKNARRLLRLVNQLLDFQKLEAGKKDLKLEPIDLAFFMHVSGSYFHSACATKEIDFHVTLNGQAFGEGDVGERRVYIEGESDALEKVAFNYLSNALKYTPRGGTIELGLRVVDNTVRLFVRDNGHGISPENQKGLFKIFSQVGDAPSREHDGTGLGLALVKELTELMGGQVGVQSAEGEGAVFWSEFPIGDTPTHDESKTPFHIREWLLDGARERTEETELVEEGPGQLVLIVDDLADMRLLISTTLKTRDYRIATAPNGKVGFELAQEHHPDLIITDWMMPVMDGPELIEKLKADPDLSSIPVVLLTARSDEESKLLGTERGADAFIGKPFNELELVSTVRNLIQLKAREHEVEGLNRQLVENVLKRYLSPDLVDQILAGEKSLEQEPRSAAATILFSDLTGFTVRAASVRAAKMARILNDYLSRMTDVIFDHGGTIDKFIGDAIMVVFGAPVPLTPQEQADRATRCAREMQAAMVDLNRRWSEQGIEPFKMRIGIHHGPVVVGNFGSKRRSDYTAIGPTVNLASRIESACDPGEIFISGTVFDYLPEDCAELAGDFELKGVTGKRHLYRLVS
ncbi:MAG: response regulator [Deltaproteobacteria bacterium]|nr:response regulator [Deltaproteobacteria bacterium]